jgi:hypothetical protein
MFIRPFRTPEIRQIMKSTPSAVSRFVTAGSASHDFFNVHRYLISLRHASRAGMKFLERAYPV